MREQIAKRFPKLGKAKTREGCVTGADMDGVLRETGPLYPELPVWQKIEHPRDNYFNIHILPVHQPLHAMLQPAMKDLKNQMALDGIDPDQQRAHNIREERFSHLWVAEIQRWSYNPRGIATFTREISPDQGKRGIYWLSLIWLNVAQRNHHVLRNTVPYFEKWHPGFVVGRDHPIVNKSLKNYPGHLRNESVANPLWE